MEINELRVLKNYKKTTECTQSQKWVFLKILKLIRFIFKKRKKENNIRI